MHDARFGRSAVPVLQHQFATAGAVDILLNGQVVAQNLNAILKDIEARDDFVAANILAKRLTMMVDILVDDQNTIGLDEDLTNAVAVVLGDEWPIEYIDRITKNQYRLSLVRLKPRNKTRSGYYRNI